MKKTLFAFLAAAIAFAAASCQKEPAPQNISDNELVFTATLGADTRVAVGESGALSWKADDKIVIYALSGSSALGSVELSPVTIDGKTACFKTDALPATATSFAAYIKGSGISGLTSSNGITGFGTETNFGFNGIPTMSCAVCTPGNLTLSFHNFASLIKVSTARNDVAYIALKGLNGESIGQTGIISPDGRYTKVADNPQYPTMAATVAGAPGTYYISIPPGINFSKGFQILLADSKLTPLATFDYPLPVTTEVNTIFNFGDFASASKEKIKDKYFKLQIQAAGKNPDDYYRLKFNISPYSFYNSTASEGWKLQSAANSGSHHEYLSKYCSTQFFDKSEIPNGSLILQMPGSSYRPEGWQALGKTNSNGSRPDEVSSSLVVVDDAWWGNFNYRAFNLYYTSPELTYAQMCEIPTNFAIFIPKSAVSSTSVLGLIIAAGYNPDDYDQLFVKIFQKSYWNSSADYGYHNMLQSYNSDEMNKEPYYKNLLPQTVRKDTGASVKFHATNVFSKDELPEGTLIVSKAGNFNYRPEGWTDMGKNTSSARPAVVSNTAVTVVDAAWWGSFNFRAFNIGLNKLSNGSYFSNDEQEQVRASFAIFVPRR